MIGSQLQEAIHSALTGSPAVLERVYDQVPENPVFPYATIGDEQVLDDSNSCEEGWEVYPEVHLWDRPDTGSKKALKTLGASVTNAVAAIASVSGHVVVEARLDSSRTLRDPDGRTEHQVLTFRFIIDPA